MHVVNDNIIKVNVILHACCEYEYIRLPEENHIGLTVVA